MLGRAIRQFRMEQGMSQDRLARECRQVGLTWSRSTMADVEGGLVGIKVSDLLVLAYLLGHNAVEFFSADFVESLDMAIAPGLSSFDKNAFRKLVVDIKSVKPKDLFETGLPGRVSRPLPRSLAARLQQLASNLSAAEVEFAAAEPRSEAEHKAARRLGVSPVALAVAAHGRWGHSLTEERDVRVAKEVGEDPEPRSAQATRAQVTTELIDELQEAFERT